MDGAEPRIIPIAEEHIEGFCAAVDCVARERRYLAFLEGPPLDSSRAFVRDNIAQGHPHYVALDGGRVVGWCDITPPGRPVYAHGGILGIGVLPAWRGKGTGRRLMAATLAAARARGLKRVGLTVYDHNERAAALYRKMGFAVEGRQRKACLIDGVYHDVILMGLLFDDAASA